MGMFDSVVVTCDCGREVEFQSKGGECMMHRYEVGEAPLDVLAHLRPEEERCECGRLVRVRVSFHAYPVILPPREEP